MGASIPSSGFYQAALCQYGCLRIMKNRSEAPKLHGQFAAQYSSIAAVQYSSRESYPMLELAAAG